MTLIKPWICWQGACFYREAVQASCSSFEALNVLLNLITKIGAIFARPDPAFSRSPPCTVNPEELLEGFAEWHPS